MSPEQLAGKKGEEIGPESDIYSLGILMYELLTGKDPYRLRKKAEILEVINIRHNLTPRALPNEIDEELRKLIMMMLERDPQKRPSDARWIGQELGRWSDSRKDLKLSLCQYMERYGGAKGPARPMLAPKRKEDPLFRSEDATEVQMDDHHFEEPTGGRELLPAFLLTLSCLLILWGLGLWADRPFNKKPASPPPISSAGLSPAPLRAAVLPAVQNAPQAHKVQAPSPAKKKSKRRRARQRKHLLAQRRRVRKHRRKRRSRRKRRRRNKRR